MEQEKNAAIPDSPSISQENINSGENEAYDVVQTASIPVAAPVEIPADPSAEAALNTPPNDNANANMAPPAAQMPPVDPNMGMMMPPPHPMGPPMDPNMGMMPPPHPMGPPMDPNMSMMPPNPATGGGGPVQNFFINSNPQNSSNSNESPWAGQKILFYIVVILVLTYGILSIYVSVFMKDAPEISTENTPEITTEITESIDIEPIPFE
jgi:hypothetical protein